MVFHPEIFASEKWDMLSGIARNVFMYLVIRANKDGKAFPSINRTANDLKHHRNSVIAAYRELTVSGLITREHLPGRKAVYTIQPVLETEPVSNGVPVLENSITGTKRSTAPVRFGVPEHNNNRTKNTKPSDEGWQ